MNTTISENKAAFTILSQGFDKVIKKDSIVKYN